MSSHSSTDSHSLLAAEIARLREEVRLDDQIIAERNKLLDMFECPDHGSGCVPNAMDEVTRMRTENARLRDSIRKALDILTQRGEDTEAWSPKIAKAVPILRESVK